MAYLELHDIHKSYFLGKEEFPVLKGIDLEFERGEFVSILGESGGGKSTLMNIIGGLDREFDGEVIVDGTMAMIYQNYELIDELNVLSNITLYRKNLYNLKSIINDLGLKPMLHHYPKELSGGEAKRVGIARDLVCN